MKLTMVHKISIKHVESTATDRLEPQNRTSSQRLTVVHDTFVNIRLHISTWLSNKVWLQNVEATESCSTSMFLTCIAFVERCSTIQNCNYQLVCQAFGLQMSAEICSPSIVLKQTVAITNLFVKALMFEAARDCNPVLFFWKLLAHKIV